jgi:uncharacterized membrane protein
MEVFFSCVVLLALAIGVIAFLWTTLRRLGALERELTQLRRHMDASLEAQQRWAKDWAQWTGQAAGPPPAAVSSEAPAPDVETKVRMAPPAYYETQVSAPVPSAAELAAAPIDPDNVETVVSTPIPAFYETKPTPEPVPPATRTPSVPLPPPPPRVPKKSLEEQLWTKLPVWLGAAALALAAAYLVKLSIDSGLLGPPVRVTMGILFGIALLVAGERLRRSSDYVARGLSAAGIAALFVSFYTATSLYHLISPTIGFGLMALTTAVAVVLSLRQGYIVAAVGLVGGLLTPALVGGEQTSALPLLLYLLLLQGGLLVVIRRQVWPSLAVLTLLGGLVWVAALLSRPLDATNAALVGTFLLLSTGIFVAAFSQLRAVGAGSPLTPAQARLGRLIAGGALVGALLAMAALLSKHGYGTQEWVLFGLLTLGTIVLARLDDEFHPLPWLHAALLTVLLLGWLDGLADADLGRFVATTIAVGALLTLGAYFAHFRSPRAGGWAALASAVPPLYLLILGSAEERLGLLNVPWGAVALGLATAMVAAALPAARRRAALERELLASPEARPADGVPSSATAALAAFAAGATTLLSMAVPFELENAWFSVAWALEVAALCWLAGRLRISALRVFAWILATLVGIRLLLNPEVLSYPIGNTPIFNWLLYGYGVPIAAFAWAAWQVRLQGRSRLGEYLEWLTQLLAFAFVSLEIRHFFYRDAANLELLRADATESHLVEWGSYAIFWLLLAHVLMAIGRRWPSRALTWGPRLLLVLGTAVALFFTTIVLNPLFKAENVGATPFFNWLLWIYGVPAALLLYTALERGRRGEGALARGAAAAALLETFLLVTFQVRQAFHGSRLDQGEVTPAENYSYSFAWILLAFALAVIGVRWSQKELRYASALIMLIAIGKVFLIDSAALDGIFRVLSFFGLGVSLFVLAYLYRRFVFPPDAAESDAEIPPT